MRSQVSLYLDLIRWNRPAGWLLLLWPTLTALWMASKGFPGWHLLCVFIAGTILMRSAGCCLNDVADKDFDKHVKRTAQRPVTTGALSSKEALVFGAILVILAFGLVLTTNTTTILWSFAALAVAIIYPYAKRFFAMPQAVLGIAFSFGMPMAFTAVQNNIPWMAWFLLAGNLFWVLAYDTEYAMVDRDDDLKIGMKTSAITMGKYDVAVVAMCYLVNLLFMAIAGVLYAYNAMFYMALIVALMQAIWHISIIWHREREACFKAFRLNHWYGFAIFMGVFLQYSQV